MKFPVFMGDRLERIKKFEKLDEKESTIVFYAENKASMNQNH